MPVELRHILFGPSEIVSALTLFSRRAGTPLPPGTVVSGQVRSVVEDGNEIVRFAMVIATEDAAPGQPKQREVTTGGAALAAALILFCRDRRIPLPSDAEKSLRRVGDQLALVVTRNPRKQTVPRVDVA